VPNVTYASNGPGQGQIDMRGLAAGNAGNQSASTTGPFPNVALYLDDESMTAPSRNVDVYMVDMERVEVLEGPQGTLFGGGAEAGALRYITNKPKINVTEGNVEASYGTTAGGADNSSANATINLPLIADTLAVRAVIFNDHRGGYIANVPSTVSLPIGTAPPTSNNALVASDTNPVTYTGIRASALWQINPDWSFLLAQSYQNMEADGYFAQYPIGSAGQPLGEDQITAFNPAYDKDKYESTAWTLNGNVDKWKGVYTGSYLDRKTVQQADYTNYLRSGGGLYYACTGGGLYGTDTKTKTFPSSQNLTCYSPNGSWRDHTQITHHSEEVRVSSPDDFIARGIVGAFWEKFQIDDQMDFNYLDVPQCTAANLAIADGGGPACYSDVGPAAGTPAVNPGRRPSNEAFGEDVQRGYTQIAFFGSLDFDIIPKVLTVTAGTRHYDYSEFEQGSQFSDGTNTCVDVINGTCQGTPINKHISYSGFKSRANITWHILPDVMVYYTWSQGFRPGAFNRTESGIADFGPGKTNPQFEKPSGYQPDSLTNNEIGLKSEFFDHRVQINLSAYKMIWKDVQLTLFNPVALGNTTFAINGPTYEIKGVELQIVSRVTDGLTVQGSSSWNSPNQSTSPCLTSNIAASPTFGQCITSVKGAPFENPFGALGTRPAFSPPLEFNLRARYDWTFNEYKPFAWVGGSHIAHMSNEPATYQAGDVPSEAIPTTTILKYDQPGYTTYDAAIGVAKDNWTAQFTGNNLSNSNASTFTNSGQFIKEEVPLRPRVLTLQFGLKF
jgi:outer membrane receptor protein involved in Fe transport